MDYRVVILIPIYQSELSKMDEYSLDTSIKNLKEKNVFFIAPQQLDCNYYQKRYPTIKYEFFDDAYFKDIKGYNSLLLGEFFYTHFLQYEFMLILQTDAILLRDDLSIWVEKPYDYIGAPWPDGNELFINLGRLEGEYGKIVKTHVGNGGLSLRRTRKCLSLLKEFPDATTVFLKTGSSEDLFFAFMGLLSKDFLIPNEVVASHFAMELRPEYYYHINGGVIPMGGHAWWKYNLDFWKQFLRDFPFELET